MSFDEERRPSGNRNVVVVLAIVGGLTLACGLGCAGLFYWGWHAFTTELPALEAATVGFLDDVNAGRLDAAYVRTTKAFQDTHSREQFEKLVGQYPALRSATSRKITNLHLNKQPRETVGTVKATVLSADNSLSFTLKL